MKFFKRGATVIPGGTFIPEARVDVLNGWSLIAILRYYGKFLQSEDKVYEILGIWGLFRLICSFSRVLFIQSKSVLMYRFFTGFYTNYTAL